MLLVRLIFLYIFFNVANLKRLVLKLNTVFTLLFSIIYGGGVGGIVCFLIPTPSFPLLCNPANPFLLWVKRGSGREKDTLQAVSSV